MSEASLNERWDSLKRLMKVGISASPDTAVKVEHYSDGSVEIYVRGDSSEFLLESVTQTLDHSQYVTHLKLRGR